MTHTPTGAEERKAMRSAPWRAVPLALVLVLALWSCNGPNRGTHTQPSSSSGLNVVVTASPDRESPSRVRRLASRSARSRALRAATCRPSA